MKSNHICCVTYLINVPGVILTYLGLMASAPRQSVWGITLVIPRDEDGNISEEFKVTDLFFQTKEL